MKTIAAFTLSATLLGLAVAPAARAQTLATTAATPSTVVDVPTRPGVTVRMLLLSPPEPKAVAVLLAGGHGGLQLFANGSMKWGEGNFLVRSRQSFADLGLVVAVPDAPSDRQSPPFLSGFRQTAAHAADLKSVIAWLREHARGPSRARLPVWLVGTSRGTQSAAYVATELAAADGPDGIVLSSTIVSDPRGRPVPAMLLEKIRVPVLVVHHELDGCALCAFAEVPALMSRLGTAPRSSLLAFGGGATRGDPCEAFAYHGFNGIEAEVVRRTVDWMLMR